MKKLQGEIWTVARTSVGTALLIRFQNQPRVFPYYLTNGQAQRLLKSLEGKSDNTLTDIFCRIRPMGKGSRVELLEKKGDIQSLLFMRKRKSLDIQAIDALDLAIKADLQVWVEEELFTQRGVTVNLLQKEERDQIEKLEQELQRAVQTEAYEEAALIRDKIKALEDVKLGAGYEEY